MIDVDVYGIGIEPQLLEIKRNKKSFRFRIGEAGSLSRAAGLGIFFSKAVMSDRAFDFPRAKRVAVLSESPIDLSHSQLEEILRRYPLVLTHQKSLIERGAPFKELLFGTNWLGIKDAESTQEIREQHFDKTRLLSFIGSLAHPDRDAYRLRREVAESLRGMARVDCYGKGIREVVGKYEAIAPYRFSVAMENAASDYYFSEKLIDCLLLETVPIYFGCPSIGDCFENKGILQFSTLPELKHIIGKINEGLYDELRPYALRNKQIAIGKRWHSHYGLFERITDVLDSHGFPPLSNSVPFAGIFTGLLKQSRRFSQRLVTIKSAKRRDRS